MAVQLAITNPSHRNTLKVIQEDKIEDKTLKLGNPKWKESASTFVKPGETFAIWLDSKGRRIVLEEMPS